MIVKAYELELKRLRQGIGIEADHPLVVLVLCHLNGFQGFPVAQGVTCTHDGQALVVAQLWGTYLQAHRLGIRCLRTHVQFPGCHTLRKGCRVEEGVFRDVEPMVVHRIADSLLGGKFQTVGLHEPLRTFLFVTTHHAVIIVYVTSVLDVFADLC